ncbi:MAG: transketolase [Candidatus Colwellbacteria bacterium]|nr:transketolase [Candidatus Colwellbacteria bacterium]
MNIHAITDEKVAFLEEKAFEIRSEVIKMLVEAGSGHSAGPLGMADIFSAFYFHILNHDPKDPYWEERDRLILSNGHIVPVRYAAMALAGYFPVKELATLRKIDSRLQGHPHRKSLPGVETTSGPLGSGLGQASGIALSARLDGKKWHTYCFMSDGEHNEGNTWESVMFAGKMRLRNLTAIIDRNNIQIDGFTEDIMPIEPLHEKYTSFGWHVLEIDGHNIYEIIAAINEAKAIYEKPTVVIAHTVPGRGVGFMENNYLWHGKPPTEAEAKIALEELRLGAKKHR